MFPEMKYVDIIRNDSWQFGYAVSLGWWIAGCITAEIYEKYID